MNKIKIVLIVLISFGFCQFSNGQNNQTKWNTSSINTNSFIENKGQFYKKKNIYEQPFVTIKGGVSYFINSNSITIDHDVVSEETLKEIEREKDKEEEMKIQVANGLLTQEEFMEEEREREAMFANIKKDNEVFTMQWVNSNSAEIIAADQTHNYYAYGKADQTTIKANSYKTLAVNSLYNNVDINYSTPKKGGVKYELTLHPGANLNSIELKWEGIKNLSIDKDGNLIITTKQGEFIDHAPIAYYKTSKKKVKIKYILEGNKVKFDIPRYDNSKTLIIDPWLTALPIVDVNAYGVHIETDDAGNSYVMSIEDPFGGRIHKFDPTGTLEWSYTPGMSMGWYGDLKVIKSTGDFFISVGIGVVGDDFERVSTSASLVYSTSTHSTESWCIQYNCQKDRLNIFGYGQFKSDLGSPFYRDSAWVFTIDELTGAVLDSSLMDFAAGVEIIVDPDGPPPGELSYGQEARASCANIYGGYFLNTITSIVYVCENYSVVWQTKFDYLFAYNGPRYLESLYDEWGMTGTRNNIASGRNFAYINRGDKVLKYSLSCGELVDSVVIPDGIVEGGDGILVDNCDNIIVGSNAGIYKFDEGFNLLASVETDNYVFDIDYGPDNTIIASGKNFVGSFNLNHCGILTECIDITVDGPIASESDTICLGDSTQISVNVTNTSCDGVGGTITWTPTTGLSDPTSYFPWASPTTTTTYIVNTAHFGCDTLNPISDTITIFVSPELILTTSDDITVCAGESTVISATGAESYFWNNAGTLSNNTIANPVASPSTTTTYTVIGQNSAGCTAIDSVTVTVNPPTIASTSADITITEGESVILTASGGTHYQWSPTTGLSCTNCPSPVASPTTTTMYCVLVYGDTITNCTDSSCVTVTVNEIECKEIFVPSGFSPNADGNNDILFVESNCDLKSLTFMVFDRWGEKVFESTTLSSGWDGTYKGKALNNGIYSYYAKAVFNDGIEQVLKGNVSLIK